MEMVGRENGKRSQGSPERSKQAGAGRTHQGGKLKINQLQLHFFVRSFGRQCKYVVACKGQGMQA